MKEKSNEWLIKKGNPFLLGVNAIDNTTLNIAYFFSYQKKCGILFYNLETKEEISIICTSEFMVGNMGVITIEGIDYHKYSYLLFEDERLFCDPYSKSFIGDKGWGKEKSELKCTIIREEFDWENDKPIFRKNQDCIPYLLHVRGFTKHHSSQVEHRGTFEGIVEKVEYLKDLGINTLEIMPCYQFSEIDDIRKNPSSYGEAKEQLGDDLSRGVINYWGYKEAFYFAPKSSYFTSKNCIRGFKEFIKKMHQEGIEIILQFFFPEYILPSFIYEVIKYWVYEYHIDGVHLLGNNIPISFIATDPFLSNTKIWYHSFDEQTVKSLDSRKQYKNLSSYNTDFMYAIRSLLKSDQNSLPNGLVQLKENPLSYGKINYLSNYNEFTLKDLVSYEIKHNEKNGENNRDGNFNNCSWNCGVEGNTKKKRILELREQQIKNALVFLYMAQGIPLIFAGDEFGNSQDGNNNPYCQDNAISWLNWNDLEKNKELYSFTKKIIAFRKEYPILHLEKPFSQIDTLSCGFPDLSYHGKEAWKLSSYDLGRSVGILFCGKYSDGKNKKSVYFAINMYWEEYEFALPKLEQQKKWNILFDTSVKKNKVEENFIGKKSITILPRSIVVLTD
ncbi:MAG: alpha-amylase family glycosyl hydrolase [Lachnospiraceae bacterium]